MGGGGVIIGNITIATGKAFPHHRQTLWTCVGLLLFYVEQLTPSFRFRRPLVAGIAVFNMILRGQICWTSTLFGLSSQHFCSVFSINKLAYGLFSVTALAASCIFAKLLFWLKRSGKHKLSFSTVVMCQGLYATSLLHTLSSCTTCVFKTNRKHFQRQK